jgi:hypothetical protein
LTSTISHLSACLAISLLALSNDRAWPQTISTVKIVVPVARGGAKDFLARVLAAQIGRAQGLAFTIENRTGAGGIIGTEAVSRSAPDGSTLLLHGDSLLIDALVRKTNYHPLTSFEPVCNLVDAPTSSPSTAPCTIASQPTSLARRASSLARQHLPRSAPGGLSELVTRGSGMEKAVRFDDDHACSAAIRMTVGQPEEERGLSVAGRQSAPVTLAWANFGRDQSFCKACCKANMSCFNSATMFRSLRFSACENASRLITLPPGLPWLCSGNRDFAFGVFNADGELIAVLSLSCIQANGGVQQVQPNVNNRAAFLV